MPGISDALTAPAPRGGARPLVPQALAKMAPKLRGLAEQLLASDYSDQFVADAFAGEGYPLSSTAVRTHRRNNKLHRFNR